MANVLLRGRKRVSILGPVLPLSKSFSDTRTRPPIIAVDFDNTLVTTDEQGVMSPVVGAAEVLQILEKEGWYIIINTCRGEKSDVSAALDFFNIPHHQVNAQSPFAPSGVSNKVMADVYVDDRALRFDGDWYKTARELHVMQPWRKALNVAKLENVLTAIFVKGLKLSGTPEHVSQIKSKTKKVGAAGKVMHDYPDEGREVGPRPRDLRRKVLNRLRRKPQAQGAS